MTPAFGEGQLPVRKVMPSPREEAWGLKNLSDPCCGPSKAPPNHPGPALAAFPDSQHSGMSGNWSIHVPKFWGGWCNSTVPGIVGQCPGWSSHLIQGPDPGSVMVHLWVGMGWGHKATLLRGRGPLGTGAPWVGGWGPASRCQGTGVYDAPG